jgi:heme oxygenase (mycobilin-producing)
MTFDPSKTEEFISIFRDNWQYIKGFEGCSHVELLQDKKDPSVFFTYSFWESEEALDNYRNSELFGRVWGATKKLLRKRGQLTQSSFKASRSEQLFHRDAEPLAKAFRMQHQLVFDVRDRFPFIRRNLEWIKGRLFIGNPRINMVVFIFGKAVLKFSLVSKMHFVNKVAGEADLFFKPPLRRRKRIFTRARMRTAGIAE